MPDDNHIVQALTMVYQAIAAARVLELLTLLRLRELLAAGTPKAPTEYTDDENVAIADIADALVAEDLERQRTAAHGFLRSDGTHAGVPCKPYPLPPLPKLNLRRLPSARDCPGSLAAECGHRIRCRR